jgi:hypothetical protein
MEKFLSAKARKTRVSEGSSMKFADAISLGQSDPEVRAVPFYFGIW